MPSDETTSQPGARPRPEPDGGHLLAIADDHRRGLHDRQPDENCSRCRLAAIGVHDPSEEQSVSRP